MILWKPPLPSKKIIEYNFNDYSDKCNTEIDCIDQSDEFYCDYLRFGENYASELVPRDESGNTLIVYMNVSVLAFPFIETIDLKFTADYFLNLKWYDLRWVKYLPS